MLEDELLIEWAPIVIGVTARDGMTRKMTVVCCGNAALILEKQWTHLFEGKARIRKLARISAEQSMQGPTVQIFDWPASLGSIL